MSPWIKFLLASIAMTLPHSLAAEEACIKYHKCISLDRFDCKPETRSSVVHRTCYAAQQRYLIIWLGKDNTAYHYCDVPPETVAEFRGADSMGRYYNSAIKGSSNGGKYDCRTHPIPDF